MRPRTLCTVVVLTVATLSGCGDDAPTPGASTSSTTRTAATTPASGLRFTTVVPSSWSDVSDQFNGPDVRYDVAAADQAARGFKPSLLILRRQNARTERGTIAEVDAANRRATQRAGGPLPGPAEPLELAGEDALMSTTRGRQEGQELVRREVIALHRGTLYVIGMTSSSADTDAEKVLQQALDAWRWTAPPGA